MPFKKGHKLSAEAEAKRIDSMKKNPSMGFLGKRHSEKTKKKISEGNKGKRKKGMPGDKNPAKRPEVRAKISKAHKGKKLSREHKENIRKAVLKQCAEGKRDYLKHLVPWNKGKKWPERAGEKNHKWKGGVTPENEAIRKSAEYQEWRRMVFERDGYVCAMCGDDSGGNLNAHHIKPFADYPELRVDVDNGQTLCESCHAEVDPYYSKFCVEIEE